MFTIRTMRALLISSVVLVASVQLAAAQQPTASSTPPVRQVGEGSIVIRLSDNGKVLFKSTAYPSLGVHETLMPEEQKMIDLYTTFAATQDEVAKLNQALKGLLTAQDKDAIKKDNNLVIAFGYAEIEISRGNSIAAQSGVTPNTWIGNCQAYASVTKNWWSTWVSHSVYSPNCSFNYIDLLGSTYRNGQQVTNGEVYGSYTSSLSFSKEFGLGSGYGVTDAHVTTQEGVNGSTSATTSW
jgi:hypothetical protein